MGAAADGFDEGRPVTTAYPSDAERAGADLSGATVDGQSFTRPLARCDLGVCHGYCCYDGVELRPHEAARIPALAEEHAAFFAEIGLELPDEVVRVETDAHGDQAVSTATRAHDFRSNVAAFPEEFTDTSCVFRAGDGRCGLQLLSVAEDRHPWHYKPSACWLHPVAVRGNPERGFRIMLPDERPGPGDPPDAAGFVGQTMCGRTVADGRPGYEVLEEELRFLGRRIGRDVLAEVHVAVRTGPPTPAPIRPER